MKRFEANLHTLLKVAAYGLTPRLRGGPSFYGVRRGGPRPDPSITYGCSLRAALQVADRRRIATELLASDLCQPTASFS